MFDGQMVVATLSGKSFVKTIRINRHGCELVSLNKKIHPD
ncbi:S24 family peptidase [Lapidilactobacillus mulanensis]|uniref:S24 family peptidase n=1 Tax=Lapidilactobacillus mulanensis TaxID=2485999 RepID=A0ABW4DM74_9LACO